MKLSELEARFLKIEVDGAWLCEGVRLPEAQGVMFLCPKCYAKHAGPMGTHSIVCWFDGCGVPNGLEPGPGRWKPTGGSMDDLTLIPSIQLSGGCAWHGFVDKGSAQNERRNPPWHPAQCPPVP